MLGGGAFTHLNLMWKKNNAIVLTISSGYTYVMFYMGFGGGVDTGCY